MNRFSKPRNGTGKLSVKRSLDSYWNIQRLSKDHDRSSFSCGTNHLDLHLQNNTSDYENRGLSRYYVLTCAKDGHRRVYGYYSLSASLVKFDQIPRELVKRYPKLDLPMIHIGRFAIDKTIQGQGRGGELLIHCLLQANAAAENIGAFGVELIARTSEAVGFYEHMGFTKIPLTNNQTYMFLPMATITKLYLDTSATNARKHNT